MANGLVGVTMADTLEYFGLFHIALSSGGAWELLYTMFVTVIVMMGMTLIFDKLVQMLRRTR